MQEYILACIHTQHKCQTQGLTKVLYVWGEFSGEVAGSEAVQRYQENGRVGTTRKDREGGEGEGEGSGK